MGYVAKFAPGALFKRDVFTGINMGAGVSVFRVALERGPEDEDDWLTNSDARAHVKSAVNVLIRDVSPNAPTMDDAKKGVVGGWVESLGLGEKTTLSCEAVSIQPRSTRYTTPWTACRPRARRWSTRLTRSTASRRSQTRVVSAWRRPLLGPSVLDF